MKLKQFMRAIFILIFLLILSESNKIYAQKSNKNSQIATLDQHDLNELKIWVGKYPIDENGKRYSNFFMVPKVKFLITDLMGISKFQSLVSEFRNFARIELVEGYAVIQGTGPMPPIGEGVEKHILVAIKLKNGETHVISVQGDKNCEFSTTSEDLPDAIDKKISIYQFGYKTTTAN